MGEYDDDTSPLVPLGAPMGVRLGGPVGARVRLRGLRRGVVVLAQRDRGLGRALDLRRGFVNLRVGVLLALRARRMEGSSLRPARPMNFPFSRRTMKSLPHLRVPLSVLDNN